MKTLKRAIFELKSTISIMNHALELPKQMDTTYKESNSRTRITKNHTTNFVRK